MGRGHDGRLSEARGLTGAVSPGPGAAFETGSRSRIGISRLTIRHGLEPNPENYIATATEAVPDTSFEVTEATDQCFGPLGDSDGTRHFTFSAVAEPPAEEIPAIVDAVRATWAEECESSGKVPEDRPAPSLFASADQSQASLVVAYPKDGHGWQVLIDSSSPCYRP